MSGVARLARFRIDPPAHRREALLTACADYAQALRAEAGVPVWEMCTDANGEDVVWLFVRASDAASRQAHPSCEAAVRLGAVLVPTIVGDPESHDLVPHCSEGP